MVLVGAVWVLCLVPLVAALPSSGRSVSIGDTPLDDTPLDDTPLGFIAPQPQYTPTFSSSKGSAAFLQHSNAVALPDPEQMEAAALEEAQEEAALRDAAARKAQLLYRWQEALDSTTQLREALQQLRDADNEDYVNQRFYSKKDFQDPAALQTADSSSSTGSLLQQDYSSSSNTNTINNKNNNSNNDNNSATSRVAAPAPAPVPVPAAIKRGRPSRYGRGRTNGLSLSIDSSMKVLRDALYLEIARKKQREQLRVAQQNREFLHSIGKRAVSAQQHSLTSTSRV
ncbi:uncharacterized protein LOC143021475 [Oratosquilla oratoria]|uniref:uncharacterized protein LOC143021475 n=1 Tax=Oratosquilla oratoria TaxID=337810 RepID=UPI003F7575C4